MVVSTSRGSRLELARFLRSRRERISPAEVGLPSGPRRRTQGLRREEVAVLAGLSPTWYTYLEQGRSIQPSRQVLDSLARVLRLTEDERRYLHILAHGDFIEASPLESDLPATELIRQLVAVTDDSPHPVYAYNQYTDLIAWNQACREWYDDWDAMLASERNMLRWMLTSPVAKRRLVDWEADTKDVVARWRTDCGRRPADAAVRQRVSELSRLSADFASWWHSHDVQEHRSRVRRFRHDHLGQQVMRIVPLQSPEIMPAGIVFHLPFSDKYAPMRSRPAFR